MRSQNKEYFVNRTSRIQKYTIENSFFLLPADFLIGKFLLATELPVECIELEKKKPVLQLPAPQKSDDKLGIIHPFLKKRILQFGYSVSCTLYLNIFFLQRLWRRRRVRWLFRSRNEKRSATSS